MQKIRPLHSWGAQTRSDKILDVFIIVIMTLLLLAFIWPLYFVLIASVSDPAAVWRGEVVLLPVRPTLDGYRALLAYKDIWIGYKNTILYTVAGTSVNLVLTICAAYPLSCKSFMPRNLIMVFIVITMFFSGGLIPSYLMVQSLHLIDTPLAMILPNAVAAGNIIITRTYFQSSIPDTLREAAELDGASPLRFLLQIVLPLSGAILAVMALYYGIAHWNSYFNALIFLNKKALFPLQLFLRDLLVRNRVSADMMIGLDATQAAARAQLAELIKYGSIIVSSLPLLIAYPFVQKHFVKGVMIGAIKG